MVSLHHQARRQQGVVEHDTRPALGLGRLTLRGPLGLTLGFYRARVWRLNVDPPQLQKRAGDNCGSTCTMAFSLGTGLCAYTKAFKSTRTCSRTTEPRVCGSAGSAHRTREAHQGPTRDSFGFGPPLGPTTTCCSNARDRTFARRECSGAHRGALYACKPCACNEPASRWRSPVLKTERRNGEPFLSFPFPQTLITPASLCIARRGMQDRSACKHHSQGHR
jgi:hypothetical protein